MFRRLSVPVLGVVENMAGFACPHCGEMSRPFGTGGARQWAEEEGFACLAEVPLEEAVRESGDAGAPIVMADPEAAAAKAFTAAAARSCAGS